MRSHDNVSQAILCCAKSDDNIRAVIINSSRANKQVKKDKYQDFDLVFFVQDINAAKSARLWENARVIEQCNQRVIDMKMPHSGAFSKLNITRLLNLAHRFHIQFGFIPLFIYFPFDFNFILRGDF